MSRVIPLPDQSSLGTKKKPVPIGLSWVSITAKFPPSLSR